MSEFSKRLLAYRAEKEISQWTLSRLSGLDHSTLSRIENKKRKPKRNTVDLICSALELPRDEWDAMLDLAGFSAVAINSLMNVPRLGLLDDIYPRLQEGDREHFDGWLDDGLDFYRERLAA